MNKYVKEFLHRGLMFGGFGPIVAGIVFFILSYTVGGFSLGGGEILAAILSTYLLAFVQAGVSVFNQIEGWPIAKSLLCHLGLLYLSYTACYLANFWIPFEPLVLLIFTAIFLVTYFVIWLSVFFSIRAFSRQCNRRLS